jgi:oxygen-independent coproporphyrinogen-3 oxidase
VTLPGPVRHAYVHVPFCPTICPFCDFHVLERRADLVDAYLDGLEREAASTAERLGLEPGDLDTIYLGGGTPSHLRDRELARLVELLRRHLGWARLEATLEAHPSTVSAARAAAWLALGFNRLSLGVQSASDQVLRFLGRPHDAARALDALEVLVAAASAARRAVSISADLITAVPGQQVGDIEADVRAVAERGIAHLSAYTLTVEEGTSFGRAGVAVDPELERRALSVVDDVASGYGLARYEVSNHARPGHESVHNLGYWRNRHYLGLGPGASAYEPPAEHDPPGVVGRRRTNPPLDRWLTAEPDGQPAEAVTAEQAALEGMLVGLRLAEGVDLDGLSGQIGLDVAEHFAEALAAAEDAGHLSVDRRHGRVRPTGAGLLVLDRVVAGFV